MRGEQMKKLCEEDLRQVVWLSDPALSPDGETAVYVRAVSDYKTGKNIPAPGNRGEKWKESSRFSIGNMI